MPCYYIITAQGVSKTGRKTSIMHSTHKNEDSSYKHGSGNNSFTH